MHSIRQSIPDVVLLEPKVFGDSRGFFYESFNQQAFREATGGQWVGALLTEDNHRQLWVPPGLAHGFLVLSESADFLYKTTDYYSPEHERCIRWDDPELAIAWPAVEAAIQLSAKDQAGRWFAEADL